MDEKDNHFTYGHPYFDSILRDFFKERIDFIKENKYPAQLSRDPATRFVMHLIPDNFMKYSLDIKKFDDPENHLVPLSEAPETILCDYNFDGLLFYSSIHEKHSYTQLFRDARVETVAAIAEGIDQTKGDYLHLLRLQKNLTICIANHLSVLHKFSLSGPYSLFFRLLAVENIKINPQDLTVCGFDMKGRNKALIRNELNLPRYHLENCHVDIKACLKPFFDILWNTFGFSESPNCV